MGDKRWVTRVLEAKRGGAPAVCRSFARPPRPSRSPLRKQLVRLAPYEGRDARRRSFAQAHVPATREGASPQRGRGRAVRQGAAACRMCVAEVDVRRFGPKKRRRRAPQKGAGACVAGDLASRGESSTRKRRRSCGERKGGDDRASTAKPGHRSWRAPKYRGRELVIEGRSLGLWKSCCLHGRGAEAVLAISNGRRMRVRVHRYAGKRQRDQRHGVGARGVASKHRRGSNRPTTRNLLMPAEAIRVS